MANAITLARFPLLFLYIALLYFGNPTAQLWSVPFILIILFMDGLDGFVARWREETSLLGSVLDIAMDRTLEYVLWVVFADLALIPILVPLIVLTRGTSVDAVRAVGMRQSKAAFEQISHPLSKFLVSSRFMRLSYGLVKALSFALLTLTLGFQSNQHPLLETVSAAALIMTWLSVVVCLLRGIPVLVEGYFSLTNEPT